LFDVDPASGEMTSLMNEIGDDASSIESVRTVPEIFKKKLMTK